MPVKLGSKLPAEGPEARIEIVPLIDIMFFLLAAFMLVSLSMVNMKNVKVNLPTATTAAPEVNKRDFCNIAVDKTGGPYLDKQPLTDGELLRSLTALHKSNANLRVIISGDRDARHGAIVHILDLVRAAGIDKVALETRTADDSVGVQSAPSGQGTPDAGAK